MNFVFVESFFNDFRAIAAQIASSELGACAAGAAICAAALYIFFYLITDRKVF